jgi:hypothetical protein
VENTKTLWARLKNTLSTFKKCVYDDIEEHEDYFKVNITENIIYLGND